jgi:hypothetical protein
VEDIKRQLFALQNNIDVHLGNGRTGNSCPTCGVNFAELADGLEELIRFEIRKTRTIDPNIEEGEITEDNSTWKP